MNIQDLNTKAKNTWCRGCANFAILTAAKTALVNLVNAKKTDAKKIAAVSGVGCHDKMYDYLNMNFFHALHGRTLPTMYGIKCGNPELTLLGFGGDGATYAEGMDHFIHACRNNVDMTFMVHNNQIFALTTGQSSPATVQSSKTPSTPFGTPEKPVNPILLALASGATFVSRGFALNVLELTKIMEAAILHKGFSFIDILMPCLAYQKDLDFLREHVCELDEKYDAKNLKIAMEKAMEWDYSHSTTAKIATGIFYQVLRPTFEDARPQEKVAWYKVKRQADTQKLLEQFK